MACYSYSHGFGNVKIIKFKASGAFTYDPASINIFTDQQQTNVCRSISCYEHTTCDDILQDLLLRMRRDTVASFGKIRKEKKSSAFPGKIGSGIPLRGHQSSRKISSGNSFFITPWDLIKLLD
mgnify:FL=1